MHTCLLLGARVFEFFGCASRFYASGPAGHGEFLHMALDSRGSAFLQRRGPAQNQPELAHEQLQRSQ